MKILVVWRVRLFRERLLCGFLMVLVVVSLLHFIVVSIKQLLVVCFYCFSVSIEFIVIMVSLGNTLDGRTTAD